MPCGPISPLSLDIPSYRIYWYIIYILYTGIGYGPAIYHFCQPYEPHGLPARRVGRQLAVHGRDVAYVQDAKDTIGATELPITVN
jgi:hypothetical protein